MSLHTAFACIVSRIAGRWPSPSGIERLRGVWVQRMVASAACVASMAGLCGLAGDCRGEALPRPIAMVDLEARPGPTPAHTEGKKTSEDDLMRALAQ